MAKPGTVTERRSGNLFIRDCVCEKKGDYIRPHCHTYDHTMFFKRGAATIKELRMDGAEIIKQVRAGDDLLMPAGVRHEIAADTDDVMFSCVFPHRDAVGRVTLEPNDQKAYW